jgi:hypothetical protein
MDVHIFRFELLLFADAAWHIQPCPVFCFLTIVRLLSNPSPRDDKIFSFILRDPHGSICSSSRDQLQIIGHDQCDHTVTRQQNPITKDEA